MNAIDAALLAMSLFAAACGFSAGYGWGRTREAARYTGIIAEARLVVQDHLRGNTVLMLDDIGALAAELRAKGLHP